MVYKGASTAAASGGGAESGIATDGMGILEMKNICILFCVQ